MGVIMNKWTREEALDFCFAIEAVCPAFGCHVALTGGLLYKEGPRKDCDILFYRIRQVDKIDTDGLFKALELSLGLERYKGFGWVHKGTYMGKEVDMFFPEEDDGEYEKEQT